MPARALTNCIGSWQPLNMSASLLICTTLGSIPGASLCFPSRLPFTVNFTPALLAMSFVLASLAEHRVVTEQWQRACASHVWRLPLFVQPRCTVERFASATPQLVPATQPSLPGPSLLRHQAGELAAEDGGRQALGLRLCKWDQERQGGAFALLADALLAAERV